MNDDDIEFINEFGKGFDMVVKPIFFAAVILAFVVLTF